MTVQDDLDQLRAQTPGCDLTAFGDLSSSLILRFSAENKLPREKLDQLCARAGRGFGVVGSEKDLMSEAVICFSESQTEVYARSSASPDDIICVALGSGHDIDTGAQAARGMALKMSEGNGS